MCASHPSNGWVVMERGGDARVFKTSDAGATWTERASIGAATVTVPKGYLHVEGVRFANSKMGWVGGWYSSTSGSTCVLLGHTRRLQYVDFKSTSNGLSAGDHDSRSARNDWGK